MRRYLLPAVLLAGLLALACERDVRLETRTFTLQNVDGWSIQALLDPYVYGDRPGAPGMMSATESAITVRETEDNLERIARVIEEHDRPAERIRLRFQLIAADGASGSDPAISDVVEELRRLFRFDGYRLLGEAVVTADRGEVRQGFPGEEWFIHISSVSPSAPGTLRLEGLELWREGRGGVLATSVTVSAGRTLVLGSAPGAGDGTVVLAVKAEREGA